MSEPKQANQLSEEQQWLYKRCLEFADACGTEALRQRRIEKLKELYMNFATDVETYYIAQIKKANDARKH